MVHVNISSLHITWHGTHEYIHSTVYTFMVPLISPVIKLKYNISSTIKCCSVVYVCHHRVFRHALMALLLYNYHYFAYIPGFSTAESLYTVT